MTASELRRWLKARGCSFEDGKKHTKVLLGTRVSYLPQRPGKEIRTGTLRTILKDLDLRM